MARAEVALAPGMCFGDQPLANSLSLEPRVYRKVSASRYVPLNSQFQSGCEGIEQSRVTAKALVYCR
jgi:hypothetical protein